MKQLLGVVAAVLAAGCPPESPPPDPGAPGPGRPRHLPTATIRIGGRPLEVEVADEEPERRTGMMFRRDLGPDEAMLFVFPRSQPLAFWMKNCPADLDLAYIRADGTIAQVEPLRAHDETQVPSREPVRFALEVPRGWFEAHGFGPGTRVQIPAEVAGGR